ncbi:MAG: DUF3450 domain-containing protein [Oscillospiraceae bacterium]|nr:DUF3450 domain-containing protein [Oscillospiraceae bacterium]
MSPEIITALIAIVSGGGLTALIKVLLDYTKQRHTAHEKEVDDRITAWQQISSKNENRIEILEQNVDSCNNEIKNLERYIFALEQTILQAGLNLPIRPQ